MTLIFERREKIAYYLEPNTGAGEATEKALSCEIRRDPLTGRSGRVAHATGVRVQAPDLGPLIEASRERCPFCPERIFAVTPRFPAAVAAEGRFVRGETVVFPNIAPYDEYSAVAAITREHYVPMAAFTPALLRDAFAACRAYLRAAQRLPATSYGLAFWNYLPASGGTQIHPHIQLFATDTPGNVLEEELAASARYYHSEGRVYWADLLEAEERAGERFIARGTHTAWLTSFVSQSILADSLILFPGQRTFTDLPDAALEEFCVGLHQALGGLAAQGIYSFNLGFFPAPLPGDRSDFWLHARLSPRVYMMPRVWGTDTTSLQHLYGEHFMVQTPEAAASALREAIRL
jgi:UDPglucose--hexose-1-phosphate uridylyltransferase